MVAAEGEVLEAFDEVAGTVAAVELVRKDAVPAVFHCAVRAGQGEDIGSARHHRAGEAPRAPQRPPRAAPAAGYRREPRLHLRRAERRQLWLCLTWGARQRAVPPAARPVG